MTGPFFEDLYQGMRYESAPAFTLTEGYAASHRAIVGDRLALPLDDELAEAVTGRRGLAHPSAVWDVVIGQSTLVTRHVVANLFYRGLSFRRFPHVGDTLRTTTEVVALKQNSRRPGRAATGLAALRIVTTDQEDRVVLDFWRCAMLPLRDDAVETGHADDMTAVGADAESVSLPAGVAGWDLATFRNRAAGRHFADITVGEARTSSGDVVSSAPELARLTLNIAEVHHDAAAGGGRRLVYGGHTIGVALAQASRELPGMVGVLGWKGCDHLGPVFEGDTLRSSLSVESTEDLAGAGIVWLRSRVTADAAPGEEPRDVLDWRFAALFA